MIFRLARAKETRSDTLDNEINNFAFNVEFACFSFLYIHGSKKLAFKYKNSGNKNFKRLQFISTNLPGVITLHGNTALCMFSLKFDYFNGASKTSRERTQVDSKICFIYNTIIKKGSIGEV